jgi:hypothetical protein
MADVQSMLSSVIGVGKTAVHKIGAAEIRRFIDNQPGIGGDVDATVLGDGGEVGASSGTVLFDATFDAGHGRVTRELVLRHAPVSDKRLFFEYDLSRQFQVQRALYGTNVPVPEPLWLDPDGRWLGTPGYVMARAHGRGQHPAAFIQGPIAEASPADREEMLGKIMAALVAIHNTDIKARGLENFTMNAPGVAPLERCINWYWQTWDWVHLPVFERLVPVRSWLLDHLPEGDAATERTGVAGDVPRRRRAPAARLRLLQEVRRVPDHRGGQRPATEHDGSRTGGPGAAVCSRVGNSWNREGRLRCPLNRTRRRSGKKRTRRLGPPYPRTTYCTGSSRTRIDHRT